MCIYVFMVTIFPLYFNICLSLLAAYLKCVVYMYYALQILYNLMIYCETVPYESTF